MGSMRSQVLMGPAAKEIPAPTKEVVVVMVVVVVVDVVEAEQVAEAEDDWEEFPPSASLWMPFSPLSPLTLMLPVECRGQNGESGPPSPSSSSPKPERRCAEERRVVEGWCKGEWCWCVGKGLWIRRGGACGS